MRRNLILVGVAVAAVYGVTGLATPGSQFSGRTDARAVFGEMNVNSFTLPASLWHARLRTRGETEVYLQSNTWEKWDGVGAVPSTGWHTHPGPSLIMVTEGTITAYDSDDPACAPTTYTKGQGFVDEGGEHSHVLRNERTDSVARTVAFQLFPAGTQPERRREDMPQPDNCVVR